MAYRGKDFFKSGTMNEDQNLTKITLLPYGSQIYT